MSFGAREMDALTALLREAARREIMPRFRQLAPDAVRTKSGPLDLVTDADEAAERMITEGVERLFPGALVVGEEAAASAPDLLGRLAGASLAIVVDPIDGTSNYVAGLPLFGVMAAVVMDGRTVGAAIHDPICGDTAVARLGCGARLVAADGAARILQARRPGPVSAMSGVASWRYMPAELGGRVAGRLGRVAASWDFRCAAHSYRLLASGGCDFLMFYRLMPWDHLAGVLLHEEAGGYATKLDSTPYRPGDSDGGLICAPDAACAAELRRLLVE